MKKLISALLALALVFSCFTMVTGLSTVIAAEDAEYPSTEVWSPVELTFTSTNEYDNPYTAAEIDATFVNRNDSTSITVPGFWKEGSTWAVRFSPTKTGLWDYTVTCTDTTNTGLHNVTGTINATAATSTTNTAQHGFIRIGDDNRHFTYADGTSFFWLGDTNWQAPSTMNTTKCNYPGCNCGGQFQHIVNDRVAKGFTVYQTYFSATGTGKCQGNDSYWSGTRTSGDGGADLYPNTTVWNERLDFMFSYLAQNDIVAAIGFGCHVGVSVFNLDTMKRMARYIVARYGCYNTAWISGQEVNMSICHTTDSAEEGMSCYDLYMATSAYVDSIDGYSHPNSGHQQGGSSATADTEYNVDMASQSWHDYYLAQGGHSNPMSKSFYKSYYDVEDTKPYVEGELQYEEINCGPFTGYDKPRYGAWKAIMNGTAGFTYGASGIWAASYSTSIYTGWLGADSTYSYEPWYMGVDKQGSYEVGYMKEFFTRLDWANLVPQFEDTTYASFADSATKNAMIATTAGKVTTAVAYFYNSDFTTGTLTGLDEASSYNAVWFNPRTGKYITIDTNIYCENGIYAIPEKPTGEDWALLFTVDSVEGLATENTYMIDGSTVTLTGDKLQPTSFKAVGGVSYVGYAQNKHDNTNFLIDGNLTTVWEPFADRTTQFFNFDFGTPKALTNIVITPEEGTIIPDYRVYASNDGEDWTIILDTRVNGEQNKLGTSYVENLYGGWRYVKVMLLNAETLPLNADVDYETFQNEYMNCSYSHTAIAEIGIYGTGNAVEASYGYAAPATPVAPSYEDLSNIYAVSIATSSQYLCSYHGKDYVTPFKDCVIDDNASELVVTLVVYNNTDATLNDVVIGNYWGTHCYLDTSLTSYDCGGRNVNIAPGEMKSITYRIPKSAYYSNKTGSLYDTTYAGSVDSGGKLCSYKDVGLRLNFNSAKPTTGDIVIACEDKDVTKNLYNTEWHATCTVSSVDFSTYEDEDLLFQFEDLLGHTPGTVTGKDASCTEDGLTEGIKCVVCGEWLKEQTVIPAYGHHYVASSDTATCSVVGDVTYTCTLCGNSYVSEEQATIPHTFKNTVIEATTAHMGYTISECTVCGYCEIDEDSYVDALVDKTEVIGYSYAVRAQHVVNNPYNASTAKPFASLNFGEGDYCAVTLKLVNNTDAVFKGIGLAQAWGTNVRYYVGEELKTYYGNSSYDAFTVQPGDSLKITINIPREAYYANGGTGITSGNDGLGVICTYDKVDLRACFATAPTEGSLVIIPLDHTEILTSLASYKLGGTTPVATAINDLTEAQQAEMLQGSATELAEGKTYIDFEGAADEAYVKSWGGTGSGISTEQALSGSYSFKQTNGTATYQSAAIKAAALTNVIDGEGTYRVSGYIYVETLPTSGTAMNINLRQTNSTYYHTQGSGVKLDETYVGVWRHFECIYNLPGTIAEAEEGKLQSDWLSKMESLAFDSIGNGSTFYLDNLCVEKVELEGYTLTFAGGDKTHSAVYVNCPSGISSLEDGTYDYTFRFYNIGTVGTGIHLCFQGGHRPSNTGAVGWDYFPGETGSDYKTLYPGQYLDWTFSVTVHDGVIDFYDYTTQEAYTDTADTLRLRFDIENGDVLDDGDVVFFVQNVGENQDIAELTAPSKGTKTQTYSDVVASFNLDEYTEAGHSWALSVVAPTCTEQGYTIRYCTDEGCGKEEKINYTAALGHTVAVDEAVAATCEATGLTEGTHCSVCKAVITAQEEVPALGHVYTGLYASKAATETENGYDIKYCTRCGNYSSTVLSATNPVASAITGATYTFNGTNPRTAFGISTTDGTDNGKVTPFKDLTFGTGDTCDVTFLIVNNTNVKLNTVSLANSWGYNCFLTAEDAAAGTKFTGGQVSCGIEAGASKTITITVPRTAYYANSGKATTDGANDGCGYICGYENVGLRFDLSAAPSSGTITFYCLTDSTVAANMVNTPSLGGIVSVAPAYDSLTSDVSADGAHLDFEAVSDASLYFSLAPANTSYKLTTANAFTGTRSIKVTCGGTYGYENVALGEEAVNAVITEAGTYCYSGWIYFETLPSGVTDAGKNWSGNLRDKDGYYYQSSLGKIYPSYQGVWVPFSCTFVIEENSNRFYNSSGGGKVETTPIGNLKSIAFDQIGVGAVYYLDNVSLEKVESGFYGRQLTYNTNASSNQGYYAGYVVTSNPSELGVGEHTLTYRVYNYSDYDAKINMRLDNGWSMNSVSRAEGVAVKSGLLSIVARSYRDITLKFTVNEDGTVSGNNAENVTISKLVLRLDMYSDSSTTTFDGIGSAMSMIFVDTTTDEAIIGLDEMSKFGAGATITDITTSNDAHLATMATFPETHDHIVVTDPAVAATCCATGLTEGSHCSVCNKVIVAQTVTPINANNHDMHEEVVNPTATEQGYTHHYCSRCDYEYNDNYVEPTGEELLLGDVNADGKVTNLDRAVLARYLAQWEGYTINEANADVDGDSDVDATDLDILTKYLANWEDYATFPAAAAE